MPELTLFYDHSCAICRAEMLRLARWDEAGRSARGQAQGRLRLVDSSAPAFRAADHGPAAAGLTAAALDRELHGITADGRVLRGLACIRQAYALTRYGWLWRVTALPLFKSGFDRFYLWFARNRHAISRHVHRAREEASVSGDSKKEGCGGACARKLSGTPT